MLPVVLEEMSKSLWEIVNSPEVTAWQKQMIHHLKNENPEINTLILELASRSPDPKSVILSGYLVYQALELAAEAENQEEMVVSLR